MVTGREVKAQVLEALFYSSSAQDSAAHEALSDCIVLTREEAAFCAGRIERPGPRGYEMHNNRAVALLTPEPEA